MSSNVRSFPAAARKIRKSKACPQSLPLHPDEKVVLDAYFKRGDCESPEALHACDRLEMPEAVECSRLEAAVAQVLLHGIQSRLPQWSVSDGDGWVLFARGYRRRPAGQALAFVPQALFTINWADTRRSASSAPRRTASPVPGS